MHPRNIYLHKAPDFQELAETYPELKRHLVHSTTNPGTAAIDFRNDESQRCLTKALLHRDFGLKLEVPSNRLCPPVPNRLNYVLWIQDIVQNTHLIESLCLSNFEKENAGIDPWNRKENLDQVRGVDIGTGASVIYPLLICSLEPTWTMYASEIDDLSLSYARNNVESNQLQGRINLVNSSGSFGDSDAGKPILWPLFLHEDVLFDFTMCNPPFYSSTEEVSKSAQGKAFEPNAVCTGADTEMITPGGETEFVSCMIKESIQIQTRCKWFTSMLGKLSSVEEVVRLLKELRVENYAITEFVQGQTRRWAVGWSFMDIRLPDSISRIPSPNPTIQRCLPQHNTIQQPVLLHMIKSTSKEDSQSITERLGKMIKEVLGAVDKAVFREVRGGKSVIKIVTSGEEQESQWQSYFVVRMKEDTWSRNARRRRKRQQQQQQLQTPEHLKGADRMTVDDDDFTQDSVITGEDGRSANGIGCTIHLGMKARERGPAEEQSKEEILIEFHWRWGREEDRGLFQSFCSHVSRKLFTTG
ncbi:hypothetical protein K435DRAFT_970677 [Dendrothele bispora CBS 962.96]|uniref:S-adenosyl-L-methionine dependent methyltransferase n=1 Tax=Dendrothele bispora (strain CBS 962.96) TaxID=1314807 RepID=A0A4S8L9R4_DENBC|nr:hypothetical protein K435DRAFT_970677 [Dendrothele bispora CBS 962.96]